MKVNKRQAKAWNLEYAPRKPKRNRDRRVEFSGPFNFTRSYCGDPVKLWLTLPVAPSANDYWQVTKPFPKMVLTRIAKDYRSAVHEFCLSKGIKPLGGDVSVGVIWYRSSKVGDLPNRTKQLYDALNGFVWLDDSQIASEHTERREDSRNPRMEVTVEWLLEIPLLQNLSADLKMR